MNTTWKNNCTALQWIEAMGGFHCSFSAIFQYNNIVREGLDTMPPAARIGDMMMQDNPHCHTVHPLSPIPHPPIPLAIISGQPNVLIGSQPAARVTDKSVPCSLPGCVPAGPGMIAKGSATVFIGGLPAARLGDTTAHLSCVATIPGPTGKIIPACCPTVMIGG